MLIEAIGRQLKITNDGDYVEINYIALEDVDMDYVTHVGGLQLIIRENSANKATITDHTQVTNISSSSLEDLADQIALLIETNLAVNVINEIEVKNDTGSPLPVSGTVTATPPQSATATVTSVPTSTVVATLAASNSSRIELVIQNNSSQILYVKHGTGASSTDYTWRVTKNNHVIIDTYTGEVTGILNASTGSAEVTEM